MLKVYGRATSGNVQKVLFLLEEIGIEYERLDYGRQFENTATPQYLSLNPTGKVPTLIDGDLAVWESHTILRYVAAKEKSPLYPSDPAARTFVERWMDWGLAALNPVFLAGFRDAKKPAAERHPDTASKLLGELRVLESQLGKDTWCAGAEMSLADVALGPIVRRCIAFAFDLPPLPGIAAWCEKLQARQSFKTATKAG